LAQEFLYTEFDWRVGDPQPDAPVRLPVFHVQGALADLQPRPRPKERVGARRRFQNLPGRADAPEVVVKTALKAAGLIGNGLYGVDLKQTAKGVVVIEVNDNPNIDHGIEDAVLKENLYRTIVEDIVWRLDRKRGK
jgi:hypothetical protein